MAHAQRQPADVVFAAPVTVPIGELAFGGLEGVFRLAPHILMVALLTY